jgi:uncharacterized protein with GYD domain
MSLYLTRAGYTPEAYRGMIANPAERASIARSMFEAASMKMHHIWMSADNEVICIVEGDAVAGTAVSMVVMASGAFSSARSVELISPEQQVAAMKLAGTVAAKYRPPGK